MAAVGFVEPWSVKAGSNIEAFISCCDPGARVSVMELDRDQAESLDWPLERLSDAFQERAYDLGSWIELPTVFDGPTCEFAVEVLFTRNADTKPVITWSGFSLTIDSSGDIHVNGQSMMRARNERWYRLSVLVGSDVARVSIVEPATGKAFELTLGGVAKPDRVFIGAESTHLCATLNARIGRIFFQSVNSSFEWRFPAQGNIGELVPIGGQGPALAIRNAPTFSVASPRFNGEVHDPRLAPDQFDAIHLHDDDFGGFHWEPDLRIAVPPGSRSGVYAVAIETRAGVEKIPFFVRPAVPKASVALLLPTATYLAYADEQLPPQRYPWHGTDRAHRFAIDNNFLSLYDVHGDLSGVSLTSSRRPRATLREDYHYPLSDSPHLLSVDLELLKFLARSAIDVDILTDHDLDREGKNALVPYRMLMTGSHPEYWSSRMMSGLKDYLGSGGSLAYLGGNGFYWVVAFQDDLMELRRGKNDIWAGRPGESHLSFTGEPGGNWEDRGLNHPQALVGVTYVIMSFGRSRPYRRLEESYSGEYAWLFAGVGSEAIGSEGRVLGAAAGYEIDAVLQSEETPDTLVRLAVADDFDDSFQVRPDLWIAGGEAERNSLRRADMTVYRHDGGGIVFSVSSVAWIGALPEAGQDNDVGRIMRNLLSRFS